MLLNARRCECLWHDLALLFFSGRGLASCLRITHHPLHCQGRWASFPCLVRSGALLAYYLMCLLHQDCVFSLPRPRDDRFPTIGAQRDLAIPSSALFASPASFLCLDANEGIGLRESKSPDCLTLQLCR